MMMMTIGNKVMMTLSLSNPGSMLMAVHRSGEYMYVDVDFENESMND